MDREIRNFIGWELTSRDTIDFKKIYVDVAEDLIAGLLLSQIIYWHLPSKENGKTRLKVQKDGHLWIAKGRWDWHEEIRITAKQYDRAIKVLEQKDFVEVKTYKFDSNPTKHVRLKWEVFLPAIEYQNDINNGVEPYSDMVITQRVKTILPKGEERSLPKGNNDITQRGRTLTESTNRDYLSESTTNNSATTTREAAERSVITFFESNVCMLSAFHRQDILKYLEDFDYDPEIINHASWICADRNKRSFGMLRRILNEWLQNNLATLDRVQAYEKTKFAKVGGSKPNGSQNGSVGRHHAGDYEQDTDYSKGGEDFFD